MYVFKRNGEKEKVHFDKITKRLEKLCYGLNANYVDPMSLTQKVIEGLRTGMTTVQLDVLSAETAASNITQHTDWGILAARIAVSNLHKETSSSFAEVVQNLYDYVNPKTKKHAPKIHRDFLAVVKANSKLIEDRIVHKRDYQYGYFGFKTLERSSLIRIGAKVQERPQYMIMRVAIAIHMKNAEDYDLEAAFETYDYMSQMFFTHASPTLFNAGTNLPQLSSCFLLTMKSDSIEGIYDTLKNSALISKTAGGIGLSIHCIRASGSYIAGTHGNSNGLVPMLRVFNNTARYVDQGGNKRPGAFAIYLEPWHADIFDFLDLKKNTGKEEKRARDLFYGLWIPDLFMQRVEEDGDWSLFCPDEAPGLYEVWGDKFKILYETYEREGRALRVVKAQQLWFAILDSQIETGTPYMLYKDSCNSKSNQQNLGTIKSSNLCVAPETCILTDRGDLPIGTLAGKEVNAWNGHEWSKVKVVCTSADAELVTIKTSAGENIDCTFQHKFLLKGGAVVNAIDLKPGDVLEEFFQIPEPTRSEIEEQVEVPYTHGFFCSTGRHQEDRNYVFAFGEDTFERLQIEEVVDTKRGHVKWFLAKTMSSRRDPNPNMHPDDRVKWLEGYHDALGLFKITEQGIHLSFHVSPEDIADVKSLLLSLGVYSTSRKIIDNNIVLLKLQHVDFDLGIPSAYAIEIDEANSHKLISLGFESDSLKKLFDTGYSLPPRTPGPISSGHIVITGIERKGRRSPTFCVHEPLRQTVIFNRTLTKNCTEIIEYTAPDEVAVCNLASIALPKFVLDKNTFDFGLLRDVVKIITRNLDKIIDINHYPIPEARNSNMRHRPIGMGVQGLADTFIMMGMAFDSPEAAKLNKDIFETIYYGGLSASCDLACEKGPYETYAGSPVSKGILQFDMWGVKPSSGLWNWDGLRSRIKIHGVRNSLLVAPMPTASTASIMGNNECFEPFTSNIYTRRVLSGEFQMVNQHLILDLSARGLWNNDMRQMIIANNGSVQNIQGIPEDLKRIYKTVWEIKQKVIIDMAADRGAFIDQSQSLNIHIPNPTRATLTSMHFHGWKKGLKTGMYYLRTKPAVDAIKFTLDKKALDSVAPVEAVDATRTEAHEVQEALLCSRDNPENCVMCSS